MAQSRPPAEGRYANRWLCRPGIDSDKSREINKFIKGLGLKGVQSQTQGEQIRVISKKRDNLQTVMAALKEGDLDIPLQFNNFRD